MFSFFGKKTSNKTPSNPVDSDSGASNKEHAQITKDHKKVPEVHLEIAQKPSSPRADWVSKLRSGLSRTGQSIISALSLTRIDAELYDDLEAALIGADTGYAGASFILNALRESVRHKGITDPLAIKAELIQIIKNLLTPLEKELVIGEYTPTVIMVAGVNGAGKTTSIGKLTRYLCDSGASVLLAAADTFRAAAREQLLSWADRNQVEIISQTNADPASVSFDAVSAARARQRDVVLIDTAGRLSTQSHLMEELKKIKRVIQKADLSAPHQILLVIDGNTGQNALAQVKSFDSAVSLTGLIVTKLDGTAKGGVLVAIALWNQERVQAGLGSVPVYFIGVGERLEDLQNFRAEEFAQALIG
jgi:fused signal recognition particle receptor